MKNYTITATANLMPAAYLAEDEVDYYFTSNSLHATIYDEDEVDAQIETFANFHPEYTFSKNEVMSK